MPVIAHFVMQIALYSVVPFYLATLRNPIRTTAFYIYFGILLSFGGFLSGLYALPVTPSLTISGGGLAYGALLMSTVLLVIIQRDIAVVRRTIHLVIAVSVLKVLLLAVLHSALSSGAVINPYDVSPEIFALSLPLTILGSALTLVELGILLYTFEFIKQRISNVTLVSTLYTLCFVVILCLDGLFFPLLASLLKLHVPPLMAGGVMNKLLLGLMYSVPMLLFLFVNRRRMSKFVGQPLTLREMLHEPQERLVEEIQRQRQSLQIGAEQREDYAQRLALATQSAGLGIWDMDLERNVVVWDDRCFEMHGLKPGGNELPYEVWEQLVVEEDRAAVRQEIAAALGSGRDYHTQFRIVWPNGEVRYIEAYGKLKRATDGSPLRMIGVNADITQRRQLAMENERLTAQFYQAQRLESIGRLAGGIAHDFNNILVPISSFAELGMRKSDLKGKVYLYFQRIKEAADRAAALTSQILAFSRNQAMEMRDADLNGIIISFQHIVHQIIQAQGVQAQGVQAQGVQADDRMHGEQITLRLELAPEPCIIKADAGQIEQVLMNLVVNARDAMPQGGTLIIATRRVYLDEESAANLDAANGRAVNGSAAHGSAAHGSAAHGSAAHGNPAGGNPAGGNAVNGDAVHVGWHTALVVSDTGTGMDEVTKQRIYEPFFTTKPPGKGTGLGLSTVFGIVKQHHGHIVFESELGRGTTFTVFVPLALSTPLELQPVAVDGV